jgi:glucose/arabinose dehydrogenase
LPRRRRVDGLNQAVGITFASDGRGFLWEKAGIVRVLENGQVLPTPLIDISDEVGNWRDLGLVGLCLDPDFATNGHIYLWYVVDYYHLMHAGEPGYDPNQSTLYHDTIGRLTRYTAKKDDQFHSIDPSSRLVLVGRGIGDGPAVTHLGHGVGTLAFGEDGTLLASIGDGASWDGYDMGGPMPNSTYTAFADGILRPEEDVGVFRSQMVDSLSGKILRLDPRTGDGVRGNPFFDLQEPRAARSRVWALGFRNPWRMTVRPGSSASQPPNKAPGVIYLGEVQEGVFDEFDVCTQGGQNFGWPLYEGFTWKSSYGPALLENRDVPNPMFGVNGCTQQFLRFQDLLVQETQNTPHWPNPCGGVEIPAVTPRFMHTRPIFDWYDDGWTRCGTFVNGEAATSNVGTPGCPVPGPQLGGGSPLGGVWYESTNFPPEYRNTYFHGDFVGGWIHNFIFDENDRPVEIRHFQPDAGHVVCMAVNPLDGGLYYISYSYQGDSQLRKITSTLSAPPLAKIESSKNWGPSPLDMDFIGDLSSDPEGLMLTYEWDFGDGATSTDPNPKHRYVVANGQPRRFNIRLRVTDPTGQSDETTAFVTVNNSPPKVEVLSPVNGATYPAAPSDMTLLANVSDAEQPAGELSCRWNVVPHHNDHTHPDPPVFSCAGTAHLTPEPCFPLDVFWYEFVLTVTDPLGLSTEEHVILHPECCPADFNLDGFLDFFDYDSFVECYETGNCPLGATADFNLDGFTDFFDYDAFVERYELGC